MPGKATSLNPTSTTESIPEKKCVGPECSTTTSTPYAKLNNGDYLCSSACSKNHYEKERKKGNSLGVWGSTPTLRVVS